jgi:hypothetical protein
VRSSVLLKGRVSTVLDTLLVCAVEPVTAVLPDLITSSFVFVVGCDVADAGVQAQPVIFRAHPVELGHERAGVADLLQVRPLTLDVAEQGLDPRLIRWLTG